jgi:hypothetical protein
MAAKRIVRRSAQRKESVKVGDVEIKFTSLEPAVQDIINNVYGAVIEVVELMSSETVMHAKNEWYKNVTEETGRSRAGIQYEMRLKGDYIVGVVLNDATNAGSKYGYMIKRPKALSVKYKRVELQEYRRLMSFYRDYGRLPPGYVAASMTDRLGRRRPTGIAKLEPNPKAADGRNLWQLLVKRGHKPIVKRHLRSLDKALQKVAKGSSDG